MLKLKNIKNSSGFTMIEAAIIGAVLVVIVIVTLVVYSHDHSPQAIILNRQKAIDNYVKHLSISDYSSFGSSLYSKGLITTSLYNIVQSLSTSYSYGNLTANPYYGLICVYEPPSAFTYGPVSLNSTAKGSLNVNVFTSGSLSSVPYKVNWVENGNTWQLNSVQCSNN